MCDDGRCDDCDCDTGECPAVGVNWADVVWSLLAVPFYTARGVMMGLHNLMNAMAGQSILIDERRRFRREAAAAIERITDGDS